MISSYCEMTKMLADYSVNPDHHAWIAMEPRWMSPPFIGLLLPKFEFTNQHSAG